MRLASFRVQNYKVIDDTGTVSADRDVTALVGRNESGKTAILRALWKSRNVAGEDFDKQLDYPRARYARDRKRDQYATVLDFALTENEAAELTDLFPFTLDEPLETVTLKTWYAGEERTGQKIVFGGAVEARCKQSSAEARAVVEAVSKELARHAGTGDTTIASAASQVLSRLDASEPVWGKTNQESLGAFKESVDSWVEGAPERTDRAETERQALDALVAEAQQGDPAAKAREWVTEHLPVFIYFDDYGQLETRIHLPTFIRQSKEDHVHPKIRTQRALFKWSGIDPEEILHLGRAQEQGEQQEDVQRRLDKRRTLLESASFELTGKWIDWWIPGTRHQLHISADGEYLVLNVSDSKNPFQIPFEERSHGFQWFFSFYLVFLVESEDAHEGAILLLDEPGLHLHPTMQTKLVDFFERVSETNQIVYSTHLPFLVDGDHLERVRTVYLNDQDPPKTVVSSDVRAGGDRDTLFPLQAAVGYSIAQTLFLGMRSVIVEGITDYWILKALNDCLAALDRGPRLHEDTVLIPAGGTRRMMPLASIMFSTTGVEGRKMLVLLDSDSEGETAGSRIDRDLFGDNSRILMLGDAIDADRATIEDLVSRQTYVDAVKQGTGRSIGLNADEKKESTNVGALAKHWERKGWGKFGADEKAAATLALIDGWGKDPSTVPTATLNRAARLFEAINSRFKS